MSKMIITIDSECDMCYDILKDMINMKYNKDKVYCRKFYFSDRLLHDQGHGWDMLKMVVD